MKRVLTAIVLIVLVGLLIFLGKLWMVTLFAALVAALAALEFRQLSAAGVDFKEVRNAPRPAKSPAERLRQMKAIAAEFKATMTGWAGDNSDREELRLLPRPLYRYDLAGATAPEPPLIDGGLFAYVMGTDPEVVLALEAVGTADKADWQYALVRATSGGLEVKLGDRVVWTAPKGPQNRVPTLPHFSMRRPLQR